MSAHAPFWGKYRGVVVNNLDPLQIGRLQVTVPAVTGVMPSTWAMPCAPMAGIQAGLWSPPLPGTNVWIEYEGGDPDYPIWSGCFWGTAAEVPAMVRVVPPALPQLTLQTPLGNGITVSDLPGPTGGILIKTATGASISVSDTGIIIQNGKGASVTLTGPTVAVNAGALTVT